jgi:uncharacterized protein YbjT (DUF2867 family)
MVKGGAVGSKALVVGATGTVGHQVVKALLDRGAKVKAASRSGTEVSGAEAMTLDLTQPSTWETALEEVDRVFLLIPSVALTHANESVPPFVRGLKAAGVRKIVCMTGMTADRPGVPMSAIETTVKESGIAYTLLRPNWFNQNFAPGFYLGMIKSAGGVFLPAADAKISFVDTRDIGAVAAASLTQDDHDGKEYTVTGPEALDHTEACAILSKAAGRKIPYTPISDDDLRAALRAQSMPPESVEEMVRLYGIVREGSCAVVSDDVATVLGRPPITFAQYAEDHAELLR